MLVEPMPVAPVTDGSLHYLDSGGVGEVVLLLHAFPLNAEMWAPQTKALSDCARVVAMHARGFGSSSPGGERLAMRRIADDGAALLRYLAVRDAVVCGLSMGGYAALELVQRHPSIVKGLLLADTRANPDDDAGRRNRETFAQSALANGAAWVAGEMAPKLQRSPADPAVDAEVRRMIAAASPAAIAAASRGMADRADSRPALASIAVPTRVVVGEKDGITPPEVAREMCHAIKKAKLVTIADAGHLSSLEQPAKFSAVLRSLVDDCR